MHLKLLTECVARLTGTETSPELTERVGAELILLPGPVQEVLRARFGVTGGEPKSLGEIADEHPKGVVLVLSRRLPTAK